MRILVVGSAKWTNRKSPAFSMMRAWIEYGSPEDVTVMIVPCKGSAVEVVEDTAQMMGWKVKRYPNRYPTYKAFLDRDQQLLRDHPDLCIGFVEWDGSRATQTMRRMERAGVPIRLYRS